MATHLVAWQEAIDSATPIVVNNVVDDVLTRSGTERYLVPPDYRFVRWAMATGPSLTRAFLRTPSMGVRRFDFEISPRARGTNLLSLDQIEVARPLRALELIGGEEIEFQAAEDAVGASQVNGFVALSPAELPPVPDGDIRINRSTATVTLTAFAWTSVSLTLDTSLEPGTYALIGFIASSANLIAARVNIRGQQYRPGMPGLAGAEEVAHDFDPANFWPLMGYNMGSFTHITVPEVQFFASVADTAERVFFYSVRTGPAPGGAPG